MQGDGNLVVYSGASAPQWASNSDGPPAPTWSSPTTARSPSFRRQGARCGPPDEPEQKHDGGLGGDDLHRPPARDRRTWWRRLRPRGAARPACAGRVLDRSRQPYDRSRRRHARSPHRSHEHSSRRRPADAQATSAIHTYPPAARSTQERHPEGNAASSPASHCWRIASMGHPSVALSARPPSASSSRTLASARNRPSSAGSRTFIGLRELPQT